MNRIAQSDAYLKQLSVLFEPMDALKRHGFITQPLTDEELLLKRRCLGCGKAMSQLKGRERTGPGSAILEHAATSPISSLASVPAGAPQPLNQAVDGSKAKATPAPQFKCKYHPGEVIQKYWTCCDQHVTADPCSGSHFHTPREELLVHLAQHHQFFYTPVQPARKSDIRAVVAIDCEMGTAQSGDTELIKVTMIDYFTGEILVNNIVEPDVPMQYLNTKYSGVTWGQMRAAQRQRTSLKATAGARHALWRFIGWDTIVVGHGVNNDLRALKWIHEYVVDSFVIESNIKKRREEKEAKAKKEAEAKAKAEGTYVEDEAAESKEGKSRPSGGTDGAKGAVQRRKRTRGSSGVLSLKTLVDRRLGRKIQLGEGKTGHDSLEDAIAARDLVHWHITNPGAEI